MQRARVDMTTIVVATIKHKMVILPVVAAFFGLIWAGCSNDKSVESITLAKRSLLGGKLSLLVPETFAPMTKEMLRNKYPAERRPTTVLTNPEGTVNIAVNHTENALQPSELSEAHAIMDQTFHNLYPSARWNRNEIVSINGREFFVLDLRTPAIDTEIRNIMVGTSFEGRFLILTFNCTRELEPQWANLGKQMIESVTLSQ